MHGPQLSINLDLIEHNARQIVKLCKTKGIEIFGVTKGTCGMPHVARAMLRGGVSGLGESRFENIRRLRNCGIMCPIMLLRSPPLSHLEEVVNFVDISLNSEFVVINELSRIATRLGRTHDIILMIDLGDLREGLWPDELYSTIEKVLCLDGIRVVGLGTNLSCFGGVIPTVTNMNLLLEHAKAVEKIFSFKLRYVSGGNSSSLPLVISGQLPAGINQLRIGEAILQGGRDTFTGEPWHKLKQNVFILKSELIEVKVKPSVPIGEVYVNSFGHRPTFENHGDRLRGILNIGREDTIIEDLTPIETGVKVLGASSDHLVIDIHDAKPVKQVGDAINFKLSYGALLTAMTSEYVIKHPYTCKLSKTKNFKLNLIVPKEIENLYGLEDVVTELESLSKEVDVFVIPQKKIENAIQSADSRLIFAQSNEQVYLSMRVLAKSICSCGLIWFDSSAKNILNSVQEEDNASVLSLTPQFSPENMVLIGLREIDKKEKELITRYNIMVFTIQDIDRIGINEVMRRSLSIAMAGTHGFCLHYDPSVTDIPGFRLGSGGMTSRETHQVMESVSSSNKLVLMSLKHHEYRIDNRIYIEISNFVLSAFGRQIM